MIVFYLFFTYRIFCEVIFLSHFNSDISGIDKNGKKVECISNEAKITTGKSGYPFLNSQPSSECLDLTSSIGCLKIPTEGNFNLNEGTVMFWVKTTWPGTDLLGYYTFFKLWHDWKHRFMIMKSEKSSYIYFYVTNPNFVEGEWGVRKDISDWKPNEWHHIAVTYFYPKIDSQTGIGCLYVDGKLAAKSNSLKRILSLPQYIELGFDSKYYSPKAYIDELAIFDRALGEKEIEGIYKMMAFEKKEISLDIDKIKSEEKLTVPITETSYNELKIPKIPNGSLVIDGNLNEKYWKESLCIKEFYLYGKKEKPKVETKSYLLYDDNFLYIGFICNEPNIEKISTNVKERDGDVWRDDCIEILIDPEKNPEYFWHIVINTINTIYDAKNSDKKFNIKGLLSGVKKGEDFWSIEVAIPFTEVCKTRPSFGDKWCIKLCRERKVEIENIAYPYQQKPFDSYTGFGEFIFGEEVSEGDIKVSLAGEKPFLGWNEIELNIEERKGEGKEIVVKIFKKKFTGEKEGVSEKVIKISPNEKKKVFLEIPVDSPDISDILICAEKNGKIFYFQNLKVKEDETIKKLSEYIKEIERINFFLKDRKEDIALEIKDKIKKIEEEWRNYKEEILKSINGKTKISETFIGRINLIVENIERIKRMYNLIVWIPKDIWNRFYPTDLPISLNQEPILKLSMAKNEYESGAICVSNLLNSEVKMRVILDDLKNESGDILPAENIKARELIWIRDMNRELRDDPLIENDLNLFEIPLGTTKVIWLTFYCGEGIKSGVYKGKIILKPLDPLQKELIREIPVEIKIRDFALPKENPIDVYFWHSAYLPQPMDFLVSSLKSRAEHRINWAMCEAWWSRGEKYDFSVWGKFFEEAKKNNLKIMFGFGVSDVNFVEKVIPYLEKYGFKPDEYVFQFYGDEFGEDRLEKAIEFGKEVKSKFPQTRWMMDIANVHWKGEKFKLLENLFPYVDIIINSFSRVYPPNNPQAKFEIGFLKNNRKTFWTYKFSTRMIAQPIIEYYRLTPWENWVIKSEGIAYWTYACFLGDPLDMFDITNKGYGWDEGIVYYGYGKDKKIIIDSKRYEALREGIEDYCYLWLLNRKIEEMRKNRLSIEEEEKILKQAVDEVLKEKTTTTIYKWREIIGDTIEKLEK
jgi:hypothetical protein